MKNQTVTYLESPVTVEEKNVAALIESFVKAMNDKDIETLGRVLTPDARVEMALHPGIFLKRSEYLQEMQRVSEEVWSIAYRNILIRIEEPKKERALVYFEGVRRLHGEPKGKISQRYLRCTQEGAQWRISESGYR